METTPSRGLTQFQSAVRQVISQQRAVRQFKSALFQLRLQTLNEEFPSIKVDSTGRVFDAEDDGSGSARQERPSEAFKRTKEATSYTSYHFRKISGKWTLFGFVLAVQSFISGMVDLIIETKVQGQAKFIVAGDDVRSAYHESFLYGQVPFSVKVRALVRCGYIGQAIRVLEAIFTAWSVVLYIRSTYQLEKEHAVTLSQNVVSSFFALDYVLCIYSAQVRLAYILSFKGIVDFISMLPIFFINAGAQNIASVPQLLLTFRLLRVLPLIQQLGLVSSTVRMQITFMLSSLLILVLIGAGVFQWVERNNTPPGLAQTLNCPPEGCYTFFDSFYFMIVTVSTVGYGEIHPLSDWGRVVSMAAIVVAIMYIPAQVNKIIEFSHLRPYGGTFSARKAVGARYVILWGSTSLRSIQQCLAQLYHPLHHADIVAFPLRVVIMAPSKPSFELQSLMSLYDGLVEFIEGSLITPGDLTRVAADSASALFLLADKNVDNFEEEDSFQFMRALAAHRAYSDEKLRVIVELLTPRNTGHAQWDDTQGVEVICTDALRFKILARSCHIKGVSTLVINLFRTGLQVRSDHDQPWLTEYIRSQQQEIFPVILPPAFRGLPFRAVSEFVFSEFGVVLFGLDVPLPGHLKDPDATPNPTLNRHVLLAPLQRTISPADVGLVIASNLERVQEISTFGSAEPSWQWGTANTGLERSLASLRKVHASWRAVEEESGKAGSARSSPAPFLERGSSEPISAWQEHSHDEAHLVYKLNQALLRPASAPRAAFSLYSNLSSKSVGRNFDSAASGNFLELYRRTNSRSRHMQSLRSLPALPAGAEALRQAAGAPEALTLEEEVDLVLTWPPAGSKDVRPHPAVIQRHRQRVLEHLGARTLLATEGQTRAPHVLVAMPSSYWPENLFVFVRCLRQAGGPQPPVVILRWQVPSAQEWGAVGHFDDVFFVRGSPLHEFDLVRAGVFNACKVVVVSADANPGEVGILEAEEPGPSPGVQAAAFAEDMRTVSVVASVERLLQRSASGQRVLCELHNEMSFSYLRPADLLQRAQVQSQLAYQRCPEALFSFTPPFMEGKAFCPSTLRLLLYKSFYNRHAVTVFELLLFGESDAEKSSGRRDEGLRPFLQQSEVPAAWHGKSFGEVFRECLREGRLALGLFRSQLSVEDAKSSFVFTNPWSSTIVYKQDLLFYLSE